MRSIITISESLENAEKTVGKLSVFGWRLISSSEITPEAKENGVERKYVRLVFERGEE